MGIRRQFQETFRVLSEGPQSSQTTRKRVPLVGKKGKKKIRLGDWKTNPTSLSFKIGFLVPLGVLMAPENSPHVRLTFRSVPLYKPLDGGGHTIYF